MPITFDAAVKTCAALGQFADAREKGDKDVILMVEKVDGRESLKTIRISELAWQQRLVRQFGFGDATLNAVSNYLTYNEPCLPPWFSDVIDLSFEGTQGSSNGVPFPSWYTNYTDLHWVQDLEKSQYKLMKTEKSRGIAQLNGCIERYQKSRLFEHIFNFPVFVPSLEEYEKIDLLRGSENPIGFFSHEGKNGDAMQVKYKAYPDYLNSWPKKNTVGFCYEHGIGVEKDLSKAIHCYAEARDQVSHFSALINLGRVCLKDTRDKTSAIGYFIQANTQLLGLIEELEAIKPPINPRKYQWIGGMGFKESALYLCKTTQEKVAKELTHLARSQ